MTTWKPRPREQAKTKAELQEMLAKAVRNTQPQAELKPLPKPSRDLVQKLYQRISTCLLSSRLSLIAAGTNRRAHGLGCVVSVPSAKGTDRGPP
jgi:hypothetical protein